MTIFIGADHRGFELKNKLVEYLQEKDIRVEDMGPYEYDKEDDAIDFSHKVAEAVRQNPKHMGIVMCGSGAAVDITANRSRGVRSGLGFNADQVAHMRGWDDINVLAIPADHLSFEQTKELIDTFIATPFKAEERMIRRNKKLDELESKPVGTLPEETLSE